MSSKAQEPKVKQRAFPLDHRALWSLEFPLRPFLTIGGITPGSQWPGLGILDLPMPPKGSEVRVTCIRVSLPQKPPLLVRSRTWFTTWEGAEKVDEGLALGKLYPVHPLDVPRVFGL